jgi:hypothetical protein
MGHILGEKRSKLTFGAAYDGTTDILFLKDFEGFQKK